MSFIVSGSATVFVAYDSRATSLPNWMNGFETTGFSVGTGGVGDSSNTNTDIISKRNVAQREDCGFTIDVMIFNRWGSKIYESNNYQNDWNGTAHGSSIGSSDKVPTGTYYYIVNLKNSGLKPFSGPIYVGTK